MKLQKLTKFTITTNQKSHKNEHDALIINKKIIENMFPTDNSYRVIVFEGTMDLTQSPYSISKQINMTQGGIGLHAIKTFDNQNQATQAYQPLIQAASKQALEHHTNLARIKYPDIAPTKLKDVISNFKVTAITIAELENQIIVQGYLTADYTNGKFSVIESATNLQTANYNQDKQK